jgi:transcriptional regulator with XRE-family HTH domain
MEVVMFTSSNLLSAAQCRAARAMVDWSLERLSNACGVDAETIRLFEASFRRPHERSLSRIRNALERAGIAFIAEGERGAGVRLKFNAREVREIKRWEAEGGRLGEDAIH